MKQRELAARTLAGAGVVVLALVALLAQCHASDPARRSEGAAAWDTVYAVLQHPRCVNCHPVGDRPLVGDERGAHPQNVQRGPAGRGLFAMRCDTCHSNANVPGLHTPPGAPNWHLPDPAMPLVFEGRSSGELCRQLLDPAQNGGKDPEQIYEHMAHDPLVMWGWDPGEGRAPVDVPHGELLKALRAWIDGGCNCPD